MCAWCGLRTRYPARITFASRAITDGTLPAISNYATRPTLLLTWENIRYLACDKIGFLSATSEAISPLECFNVIATADTPSTFQLQTLRETLVTIKPSTSSKSTSPAEIRGDEDKITFNTTMRIRMQARFKPKLKASKEEKALSKISRRELEEAVGRRLDENEVKVLKRARREGDYHERLLDLKVKNRHDKFG